MTIKLSIIVPCYNTSEYIEDCLNSLMECNYRDIEFLIINDASSDNTAHKVKRYCEIDDRFHLINLEKNIGLGFARNHGIEIARGEWLCFLDSDDWIDLNNLFYYLNKLYSEEIIVFGFKIFNEFNNQFEGILNSPRFKFGLSKSFEKEPNIASFTIPNSWQFVVRKKFLLKNKIFFKRKYREDKDFAVNIFCKSKKINFLQNVVTHYYRKRYSKNNKSIMQQNFSEETFYLLLDQQMEIFKHLNEFNNAHKMSGPDLYLSIIPHITYSFMKDLEDVVIDFTIDIKKIQEYIKKVQKIELFLQKFFKISVSEIQDLLYPNSLIQNYRIQFLDFFNYIEKSKDKLSLKDFNNFFPVGSSIGPFKINTESPSILSCAVKRIIIHIGDLKTGTTSIQKFFSLNNHQLEKEGIFFPNFGLYKEKGNNERTSGHWPIFKSIKNNESSEINHYSDLINQTFSDDPKLHTLMLSSENIFDQYELNDIKLLKNQIKDFSCNLVLCLRNPYEWMWSKYVEDVAGGNLRETRDFETFIFSNFKDGIYNRITMLNNWDKVFGKQLNIILYNKNTFFNDFLKLINKNIKFSDDLTANLILNKSNLEPGQVELLRLFNLNYKFNKNYSDGLKRFKNSVSNISLSSEYFLPEKSKKEINEFLKLSIQKYNYKFLNPWLNQEFKSHIKFSDNKKGIYGLSQFNLIVDTFFSVNLNNYEENKYDLKIFPVENRKGKINIPFNQVPIKPIIIRSTPVFTKGLAKVEINIRFNSFEKTTNKFLFGIYTDYYSLVPSIELDYFSDKNCFILNTKTPELFVEKIYFSKIGSDFYNIVIENNKIFINDFETSLKVAHDWLLKNEYFVLQFVNSSMPGNDVFNVVESQQINFEISY